MVDRPFEGLQNLVGGFRVFADQRVEPRRKLDRLSRQVLRRARDVKDDGESREESGSGQDGTTNSRCEGSEHFGNLDTVEKLKVQLTTVGYLLGRS